MMFSVKSVCIINSWFDIAYQKVDQGRLVDSVFCYGYDLDKKQWLTSMTEVTDCQQVR